MKRLSFFLAGIIAGIAGLMAEQPMWSVSGTVFDFEGRAVPGAAIFAKADTVTYGMTTGSEGEFEMLFEPTDSVCLKVTMTGYKPVERRIRTEKEKTVIDIVLEDRAATLDEVTVEADMAETTRGGMKYYINAYQREASNDAYTLLNSMNIPGIDVDRRSGKASTATGEAITYYVDGHPASDMELRAIRPKDVLRVEFYDYPLPQFDMKRPIINYVMKKYEYGGYVSLSGTQGFLNENGDYRANFVFNKKKLTYMLLLNGGYSDLNEGTNTKESYRMEENGGFDLSRERNYIDGKSRNYNLGATGLLQYQSDGLMLQNVVMLNYNKQPKKIASDVLNYTPELMPPTESWSSATSKGIQPFWMLYVRKQIKKNQMIAVGTRIQYANTESSSRYTLLADGFNPIANDAKSHTYNYMIGTQYSYSFKNNCSLIFSPKIQGNISHVRYTGTNPSLQDVGQTSINVPLYYQGMFKNKYEFSVTVQGTIQTYKVNDNKRHTEIAPTASLYLNIPLSRHARIGGNIAYMIFPGGQAAIRSETTQQIDEITLQRGNPDMGMYNTMFANVFYTHAFGNFILSPYAYTTHDFDSPMNTYYMENGMLVKSYADEIGDSHYIGVGLDGSLQLFDRSLVLKAGVNYKNYRYTGLYDRHGNYCSYSLGASYYYRKFSVSLSYKSKQKGFNNGDSHYEIKPSYDLFMTYGHRNWYFEAGCSNVFNKGWYEKTDITAKDYLTTNWSYSDAMDPQFYVKVSYSFDFGRKLQHTKPMEIDSKIDDGIMMPD